VKKKVTLLIVILVWVTAIAGFAGQEDAQNSAPAVTQESPA